MELIYVPDQINAPSDKLTIFLSGSIETSEVTGWRVNNAS
jgi:hypothetical protein